MKRAILTTSILMFLTVTASGQTHRHEKDVNITLLSAGTATRPISLAKRWFEGDTIYIITFRDIKGDHKSKTVSQGFFKPELKEFGSALNTGLTIGLDQDVRFSYGTMTVGRRAFGRKYIKCAFSSKTGTFRANDIDVQKLVDVINKQ